MYGKAKSLYLRQHRMVATPRTPRLNDSLQECFQWLGFKHFASLRQKKEQGIGHPLAKGGQGATVGYLVYIEYFLISVRMHSATRSQMSFKSGISWGLPWWSSGCDYSLAMQGARVWFLVRELKVSYASTKTYHSQINNFFLSGLSHRIRKVTDWKRIPQKTALIPDCYPKYTKNASYSTISKTITQF